MKVDQSLLKEVCKFIAILITFDKQNTIVDHFAMEIKATIEPLRVQIMQDLEKLSRPQDVEMRDDEEEKIDPFSEKNVGVDKLR